MSNENNQNIYLTKHYSFFEKILLKKRQEVLLVIKDFLKDKEISDVLDVGSTEDENNDSSNYLIKNIGNYKNYNSISDQTIKSTFFSKN